MLLPRQLVRQKRVILQNEPTEPEQDRRKQDKGTFDRTLSQLERVQRMRLGQPVLSKLEVHSFGILKNQWKGKRGGQGKRNPLSTVAVMSPAAEV